MFSGSRIAGGFLSDAVQALNVISELYLGQPHANPDQHGKPNERQQLSISQADKRDNHQLCRILDQRHGMLIFINGLAEWFASR
jgi:hypothetical protein